MPQQESFLSYTSAKGSVEVLKTYDRTFAREAFDEMGQSALLRLTEALEAAGGYDPVEAPPTDNLDHQEFVWEELLEAAREDGNLLSFFVVVAQEGDHKSNAYVSPDWPSAEAFAKGLLKEN